MPNCKTEIYNLVTNWSLGWVNRKSGKNNNSTPGGGGILRISSDGDDRRICLGLKFSIPGFFGGSNIW